MTDLSVLSHHTLDQQVRAQALTWLDRQAFGQGSQRQLLAHPAVQEALRQREAWLVQHGYAEHLPADGQPVAMRSGALKNLANEERKQFNQKLHKQYGKPISELPKGREITGAYGGTHTLHTGRHAVIVTSDQVYIGRVRQAPAIENGTAITARRENARSAEIVVSQASVIHTLPRSRGENGLEAGQ